MRQRIMAVLCGLAFCTPMAMTQTSGFSQQGKVTHEMRDDGFSIAHSSLPLNSKAKIANTSTGKEVEVTITRLIPASSNRIADVSSSVWQELGLTPDTDARIYTVVTAKPQTTVSQTAAPQTTVSQTPASQTAAPVAVRTQEPAARTAQTGTGSGSLGDLPSGVKFENNNNFIINGNPAAPSAVTSETRTQSSQPGSQQTQPSVTYYETPPAQPAVPYYETRPQQAQPAVTYETRPQQTQPSVTYGTAQPAVVSDMWAQITRPAVEPRPQQAQPVITYDTRTQQAQPVVTYDTWTQPVQPVVRVENQPQVYQPVLPYETWTQQVQPSVTYYETGPGQPVVKIVNWPQTNQQSYETQTAQPLINYETRTQEVPEIPVEKPLPQKDKYPPVNEILTPVSRTFVYIDAPPQAPRPSVIIDNGPQSYWQSTGENRN